MQGKNYYIPGWSEAKGYYSPYVKGPREVAEAGLGRNCFGFACAAREAALRNQAPPGLARSPRNVLGALGRGLLIGLAMPDR